MKTRSYQCETIKANIQALVAWTLKKREGEGYQLEKKVWRKTANNRRRKEQEAWEFKKHKEAEEGQKLQCE